jgi:hypothetical protein
MRVVVAVAAVVYGCAMLETVHAITPPRSWLFSAVAGTGSALHNGISDRRDSTDWKFAQLSRKSGVRTAYPSQSALYDPAPLNEQETDQAYVSEVRCLFVDSVGRTLTSNIGYPQLYQEEVAARRLAMEKIRRARRAPSSAAQTRRSSDGTAHTIEEGSADGGVYEEVVVPLMRH